jgi:hypothetical protein
MTSSPLLTDVILKYFLSLVMSLGVALTGLGGLNLVFLQISLKFITTFPMLPDPIPYSESESLSLRRRFRFLVSFFLITFSSLSNFLLNCAKDCFVGLGFFPPFLAARKSDFSVLSFSKRRQLQILCIVYAPPCFLQRLQYFLVRTFFGTLGLWSVPGRFVPFYLLCKAFSSQEGLDLSDPSRPHPSRPHTRSIALRD